MHQCHLIGFTYLLRGTLAQNIANIDCYCCMGELNAEDALFFGFLVKRRLGS